MTKECSCSLHRKILTWSVWSGFFLQNEYFTASNIFFTTKINADRMNLLRFYYEK